MDEELMKQLLKNLSVEGAADSGGSVNDDDSASTDSEELVLIIEGLEVELIQQAPEPALDGATDCVSYLLKGKAGRKLKLAISEVSITEIHSECLGLFESGRLPRIHASEVEVISDHPELTIHANTVKVTASYPVKKYSAEELSYLEQTGELELHPVATQPGWCLITLEGIDTLFGSDNIYSP